MTDISNTTTTMTDKPDQMTDNCPHCGSNKDPWFSRSEPMGYYCEDCGQDVDSEPRKIIEIAKYWRDISECVCGSSDPIGSCLRCDMEEIINRLKI